MKIAIFSDVYTPASTGGIVSSIVAQKAELTKLGHEVTIFCPGLKTDEENVVLVPSHPKLKINDAIIAKKPTTVEAFVEEKFPNFKDFDLVHVHYEASCSIAGARLARKYDIPLVQTMHGREDLGIAMNVPHGCKFLVANFLMTMHRRFLRRPFTAAGTPAFPCDAKVKKDKFLAPSHTRAAMWQLMVNQAETADVVTTPADHMAKKLEHYGVSRPIVAVSNGIREDITKTDFAERKLNDGDVLKMVWCSRLSGEKRVIPFLKAVAQLKRPYVLYMYGDGNAEKAARKYVAKHKMKVKFFGAVTKDKMMAKLKESHLMVLASYNFDTQAMTLLEAEAVGLPVFFCDPTLMEVVPRGSYVLSGGPEPEAMAIALNKMDSKEINEMSKIMLKNRAQVAQPVQTEKMLKVYQMAINEHKKQPKFPL